MIKEVTKKIIYIAVINIINDEGYASVTMDKVAEAADVAKGTIYAYFKNKEELLREVFDDALFPITETIDDILLGNKSPEEKLSAMATAMLKYFDENNKFFRIMMYERELMQLEHERFQDDRYHGAIEKLTKVIEEGIKLGKFRKLNPKKVATIFLEAIVVTTKLHLLDKERPPIEDDLNHILEITLNGIKAK
jgi:AcrR family transcriptional regulator